ncbi:MAG: GNAT family N-acetyltransferase [Desulfobacteraceae bacterium]|nr:GNAT family N-acetyltransferase [Desulfobacteraceae bacterium]
MYTGKNISLRPFKMEDAQFILELKKDFNANKSFAGSPFPSDIESEKEWISNMYPPGIRETVHFAIEENKSNKFIGYIVARRINYINSNAEIGTILIKEERGKKYFKEISVLFYSYLFNELNLHKVYSSVITSNTISLEAHKKIGFTIDGERKEHIWQDGQYKDVYLISLFASDLQNQHKVSDYLLTK